MIFFIRWAALSIIAAACKTSSPVATLKDDTAAPIAQKTPAGRTEFREEIPELFIVCGDEGGDETKSCSPDGNRLRPGEALFFALDDGPAPQPAVHLFSVTDASGQPILRHRIAKRGQDYEYLYKYATTSTGQMIRTEVGKFHNQVVPCSTIKTMIDPEYNAANDPQQAQRSCKVLWNTRLAGQFGMSVTMLLSGRRPQVVEQAFAALPAPVVDVSHRTDQPVTGTVGVAKDLTKVTAGGRTVAEFLADFYRATSPSSVQVKGCLHNSRTRGYADAQAYVYCLMPHENRAQCFGKRLNDYRMACPVGTVPDFRETFDYRFVGRRGQPPALPIASYSFVGPDAWRAELFRAAFTVVPGYADYSVESVNKTLDEFFASIGETRLKTPKWRRVIDPDFGWLAAQPRYSALRQLQAANVAKEKNGTLVAPPVCDPRYLTRMDEQTSNLTINNLQVLNGVTSGSIPSTPATPSPSDLLADQDPMEAGKRYQVVFSTLTPAPTDQNMMKQLTKRYLELEPTLRGSSIFTNTGVKTADEAFAIEVSLSVVLTVEQFKSLASRDPNTAVQVTGVYGQ